jgi:hypothetical protein
MEADRYVSSLTVLADGGRDPDGWWRGGTTSGRAGPARQAAHLAYNASPVDHRPSLLSTSTCATARVGTGGRARCLRDATVRRLRLSSGVAGDPAFGLGCRWREGLGRRAGAREPPPVSHRLFANQDVCRCGLDKRGSGVRVVSRASGPQTSTPGLRIRAQIRLRARLTTSSSSLSTLTQGGRSNGPDDKRSSDPRSRSDPLTASSAVGEHGHPKGGPGGGGKSAKRAAGRVNPLAGSKPRTNAVEHLRAFLARRWNPQAAMLDLSVRSCALEPPPCALGVAQGWRLTILPGFRTWRPTRS